MSRDANYQDSPKDKAELDTTETEEQKILPIYDALNEYLSSIRAIGITAQVALPHIEEWAAKELHDLRTKVNDLIEDKGDDGQSESFEFKSAREFSDLIRTLNKVSEVKNYNYTAVLSTSLFTQMFSAYDSFIGDLLKSIFSKNEELLKGISREISLSELLEYDDLKLVKTSIVDKEIETFRRDSYIDQFISLENKFGFKSLRNFKEWPEFVEASQRRNILTHNGGAVSEQYLHVCKKQGFSFTERPLVSECLSIDNDYFEKANRLLSKVGLMLAFTLWCKVFPKESEDAHQALNNTIYNCLEQKRWKLVAELSDFVLSDPMKKGIKESVLRVRIINSAIGLKFSGNVEAANSLLSSLDWSASYRDFKLAIAVLKEDWDEACSIMKSIGKTGEIIDQTAYHTWPLFAELREQSKFYDAYMEIYEEHFSETVPTPKGEMEAHPTSKSEQEIMA